MTLIKPQKEIALIKNNLFALYPMLRDQGMYNPAKHGRTILTQGQILAIFDEERDAKHLVDVAIYVTSTRLKEFFDDKRFQDAELPGILNQHFDFAELILLHHSERLPGLYEQNIEFIEEKRGKYLGDLATAGDANEACWTEYAYWLLGRAEKSGAPAEAAQAMIAEAEMFLRKAHDAGYVEATEALATLLYVDKEEREEAISLWGAAASTGDVRAIQNLSAVVMDDDSFSSDERTRSLTSLWHGIAANKSNTRDIAKTLKQAGYTLPVSVQNELVPA